MYTYLLNDYPSYQWLSLVGGAPVVMSIASPRILFLLTWYRQMHASHRARFQNISIRLLLASSSSPPPPPSCVSRDYWRSNDEVLKGRRAVSPPPPTPPAACPGTFAAGPDVCNLRPQTSQSTLALLCSRSLFVCSLLLPLLTLSLMPSHLPATLQLVRNFSHSQTLTCQHTV